MQEEVNQKTVALSIKTAKLTGKVLAAALGKVVRALQKHHRKALTPPQPPSLQGGGHTIVKLPRNPVRRCTRKPQPEIPKPKPGMKTSLLQGGRTTTKRSRTRKENKSHEKID